MFKAGKVAIIGRPNVGKSTLLNALIKEKLCIVSHRPETTRDNIQGIISGKDFQIVFIDTPGIHRPRNLLGKTMVSKANSSILESDLVLVVIDAKDDLTSQDIEIFNKIPDNKTSLLIINKIDLIDKRLVLPIIEKSKKFNFKEIIPISAYEKNDIELVFKKILDYLPEGYPLFPEDQLTDKPEKFCIQEIIREKVLELTYEEIPHSVAVSVEEMKEKTTKNGSPIVYIRCNIYVERQTQKAILIGKNGSMLKKIGCLSRKDIENFLSKKAFLELFVKVFENWKKNPQKLKELGYL